MQLSVPRNRSNGAKGCLALAKRATWDTCRDDMFWDYAFTVEGGGLLNSAKC